MTNVHALANIHGVSKPDDEGSETSRNRFEYHYHQMKNGNGSAAVNKLVWIVAAGLFAVVIAMQAYVDSRMLEGIGDLREKVGIIEGRLSARP